MASAPLTGTAGLASGAAVPAQARQAPGTVAVTAGASPAGNEAGITLAATVRTDTTGTEPATPGTVAATVGQAAASGGAGPGAVSPDTTGLRRPGMPVTWDSTARG